MKLAGTCVLAPNLPTNYLSFCSILSSLTKFLPLSYQSARTGTDTNPLPLCSTFCSSSSSYVFHPHCQTNRLTQLCVTHPGTHPPWLLSPRKSHLRQSVRYDSAALKSCHLKHHSFPTVTSDSQHAAVAWHLQAAYYRITSLKFCSHLPECKVEAIISNTHFRPLPT